ncbi:MAG: diguanylate cyclase [Lachnospiraceae bacterium]|nr:diguanylate cyclase [Lachnospiraceae bacterium]
MQWIYIVDDDAVNRRMAGHFLSKAGMRVSALESGQAFLDHVSTTSLPDLVLLDIRMPDMDGFETLERFRMWEKENGLEETPVIFLTADEDSERESRGLKAGASDYIHKPFDPDILVKRIRNVIDRQETISTLKTEATQDNLTGFLNKAAVNMQFPTLCKTETGCLMMLDLDSFKLVNDIYGHEMGDKVLGAFADLAREGSGAKGTFGRIGGDEFVLFFKDVTEEKEAENYVNQLNTRFLESCRELMGAEMVIPLGVSAGAVFVPKQGNDFGELLRCADKALYLAKTEGGHKLVKFREISEMHEINDEEPDIKTLSAVHGERSIPDNAFQLDKRAFSFVYQFIMRYMTRNKRTGCKVLFVLDDTHPDEKEYRNLCDTFDEFLKQSLRKSDVFTRSRFNQFFVFLTDIHEEAIQKVIDNLMKKWNKDHADQIKVTYETEYVTMDDQKETVQ